jgi:alkylation response protein AidB-like acyl-CoA dehydrogenase
VLQFLGIAAGAGSQQTPSITIADKKIGRSASVTTNSDGAWEPPHEFRQTQETARRFMRERVIRAEKPLPHDAIALPDEVLKPLQEEAKKLGFWHVESPAEWGGAGLNLLGQAIVAKESSQCEMGLAAPARLPGRLEGRRRAGHQGRCLGLQGLCDRSRRKVVDRRTQMFGGLGVAREMPLERWYREMRIKRIGEGTSEVHRVVVARDLPGVQRRKA